MLNISGECSSSICEMSCLFCKPHTGVVSSNLNVELQPAGEQRFSLQCKIVLSSILSLICSHQNGGRMKCSVDVFLT